MTMDVDTDEELLQRLAAGGKINQYVGDGALL